MPADFTYQSVQILDTVTDQPARDVTVTFKDATGTTRQTYDMDGAVNTLVTDRHGIVWDFKADVPTGELVAGANTVGVFSYEGFASKAYVDQLATGDPAEISDAVMAGFVNDPSSSTAGAVDDRVTAGVAAGSPVVNVLDHGATGDGTTDDGPAIRAAVVAAPAGGVVWFPHGYTFRVGDAWVDVDKALTLTGPGLVKLATGKGFRVTSSDVTFDGLEVEGPGQGAPYVGTDLAAIYAPGTSGAPLDSIRVTGCHLHDLGNSGVWLEWVTNARVAGNHIRHFVYGGVMLLSARDTTVVGNSIHDCTMATNVDSYGVAVTDATNTLAGRSARVAVVGNTIRNIPREGIDTHGGTQLTVVGNVIAGCFRGIALVVGNASRVTSPQECVVSGNTVDSAGAATLGYGIGLHGLAASKASATITGNRVVGYATADPIYLDPASLVDYAATVVRGNTPEQIPWQSLPVASGWSSVAGYEPQFAVIGDEVHLRGLVKRDATGSAATVAVLPVEARPVSNRLVPGQQTTSARYPFSWLAQTTGDLTVVYIQGAVVENHTLNGVYRKK